MDNIYLLRGVSGSGKSTLAETLERSLPNALALSSDDFFMIDGEYVFDGSRIGHAHGWCLAKAITAMSVGVENLIIHNTLTTENELAPYILEANNAGYNIISLVVENRRGSESVHGVPDGTRTNQANRLQSSLKLM